MIFNSKIIISYLSFFQDKSNELPKFAKVKELSDLSNGVGLAVILSLYCPDELPWGDIAGVCEGTGVVPSMSDSLYNLQVKQQK